MNTPITSESLRKMIIQKSADSDVNSEYLATYLFKLIMTTYRYGTLQTSIKATTYPAVMCQINTDDRILENGLAEWIYLYAHRGKGNMTLVYAILPDSKTPRDYSNNELPRTITVESSAEVPKGIMRVHERSANMANPVDLLVMNTGIVMAGRIRESIEHIEMNMHEQDA